MYEHLRSPERTPSLLEQVATPAVLQAAWQRVQRRGGRTPGADQVTFDAFVANAPERLARLGEALRAGTYQPRPLRRLTLERAGKRPRRLALPALRDRVVQTALLDVLTPRVEAVLNDAAYAYRPGRSHAQAAQRLQALCAEGRPVVARGDIARFFESVPHAPLLAGLDEVLGDTALTGLIARLITTPVEGETRTAGRGLPQGSALSPLLSNLYLLPFDATFDNAGLPLVRYADDFAVACRSASAARHALQLAEGALRRLRLYLHRQKTHIACYQRGFRFLGQALRAEATPKPAARPVSASTTSPTQPSASMRTPVSAPTAPPALAPRTLYLQTQGATLSVSGSRFVVTPPGGGDVLTQIGIPKVGEIVLLGTVHLTPDAMKRCLQQGIPVTLLSTKGSYYGRLASTAHTSAHLVRAQCALAADPEARLDVARTLVRAKLRGSRNLLRRYGRRMPHGPERKAVARAVRRLKRALRQAKTAPQVDTLLGVEGAGAAAYFQVLGHLVQADGFTFTRRTKRPPQDAVNALLSLAYTLAHAKLHALAELHRLHPYVGFLHADAPGHPALASDLLEPFRPALDAFVLRYVNSGQARPADFERRDGGCFLRKEAFAGFVQAFEHAFRSKRPASSGQVRSLWQAMERQTASLVRFLRQEAPAFSPYRLP